MTATPVNHGVPARVNPVALDQAQRGVLGRKHPCWCGSGRRYKHCHFDADRVAGDVSPPTGPGARPKLSAVLKEIALPLGLEECATIVEARAVVLMAAGVWNAMRLRDPGGRARALAAVELFLALEGDRIEAIDTVSRMCAVADRWDDDDRVVLDATVVPDGPGKWRILATSAVG